MKETFEKQHRLAKADPYHSIVKVLEPDENAILVGIKNVSTIPNSLMHQLEKTGFGLHTIDKKSQLAGRAVDTELINPITGRWMSGSSSGTAVNVFAGINDLGVGSDGGGSVLAPAMCVNIIGFISKLICPNRVQPAPNPNTDGIIATNSIGFMSRDREILLKAIKDSIGVTSGEDTGIVFSDQVYDGLDSQVIPIMDPFAPRAELTRYLQGKLTICDVLVITEGPVDVEGFGDSLFGHFDERTKAVQKASRKGYLRVCNIAGATALSIPQKGLGMATLLMCESKPEKVARLLKVAESIPDIHDDLIERYFLNLDNYFWDGYEI
jgi:hypothetical protein